MTPSFDILRASPISFWQLLIIAVLVIVLFGKGKISDVMGEFGKGIKGFKKGLQDADDEAAKSAERVTDAGRVIEPDPAKDKTHG